MKKIALTVENLTKIYFDSKNKKENVALNNLNFKVNQGEVFGLLGPNGAGKTTFLSILAGTVSKTKGTVNVWGFDIDKNPRQVKASIGIVPQEINLDAFFSPKKLLELQAGLYGVTKKDRITELILNMVALENEANAYSRNLSGGMKRRLLIAKAMVHQPPILILDEPTAGVDIELRRSLWDFLIDINKAGTTIILTTHYLEEAENLCRNIAIIDEGQIIENTKMSNLLQQLENQVFSIETNAKLPENFSIEGFDTQVLDENKFTVIVPKDVTINDLFDKSELRTIEVANMKNQTNRLEELFLNLTAK